jgi:hypothetical protein
VSAVLLPVAAVCAGLFAGAAAYVSFVEHPARISCGPALALREFRPSYGRGTVMQVALALLGSAAGFLASAATADPRILAASILLLLPVPYTLLAVLPTNKRLLDPALEAAPARAEVLLRRWGRLHAVRTAAGLLAFVLFLLEV